MVRRWLVVVYWLVTALFFAGAVWMVFAWTPEAAVDNVPQVIQKIYYMHLPIAINAFMACLVVCVGAVGYLATRRMSWDDLATAAAKVAVVHCSLVLVTGMIWARGAWNVWWTWSSTRLTFSFMLWLLYVVYLVLRGSVAGTRRRALGTAVYGGVGFLDVPLVWLSTRLLPDTIHPARIGLTPKMQITLAVWFVPVTLMTAGLVALQYRLERQRRETAERRSQEMAEATGGAA
jgi:heme exporter protein C